jgi:hypothetical protein
MTCSRRLQLAQKDHPLGENEESHNDRNLKVAAPFKSRNRSM